MFAWKIYGLTVVALFLKMLAIVLLQVNSRHKSNTFASPEDAVSLGKGTSVTQESLLLQRASRILNNDGENIPIFLFLATAYVSLGCWEQGTLIYFPLFVLSRITHSVAYLRAIQPLRTRAYQLGLLIMLVLCGHIVWAALQG